MKIIWTGTDSLFLVKFPKQLKWTKIFYVIFLRIWAKISDIFIEGHYACGELVRSNLIKYGLKRPIKLFIDPVLYDKPVEKRKHHGLIVLYYFPLHRKSKFVEWLYGYDIFNKLKEELSIYGIIFITVSGKEDMNKIYPIIDLYIRPNRHDGHPRMIDECVINDIDYIATKQNPEYKDFYNKIINLYNEKCGGSLSLLE